MEAIDFIDSGIAGFPGLRRGARAKTSIGMTKLYLVQLAARTYDEALQKQTRAARLKQDCGTSDSRPAVKLLRRPTKIAQVVDRPVDVRRCLDAH